MRRATADLTRAPDVLDAWVRRAESMCVVASVQYNLQLRPRLPTSHRQWPDHECVVSSSFTNLPAGPHISPVGYQLLASTVDFPVPAVSSTDLSKRNRDTDSRHSSQK